MINSSINKMQKTDWNKLPVSRFSVGVGIIYQAFR